MPADALAPKVTRASPWYGCVSGMVLAVQDRPCVFLLQS